MNAFAHAVQSLQLKGRPGPTRHLHDGRDGAGVVAGELRVDHLVVADQPRRAGQVGHVGVALVREHRVARQAAFLRAFDFAIPVRALDQAHDELQAVAARHGGHFVHQLQRAGLIGLQRQAEAAPLRKLHRHARGQRVQQVQREFQPVALFGVNRQVDVGMRSSLYQGPHARQQFGKDPFTLRVFIPRIKRTELDRDLVTRLRPGRASRRSATPAGDHRDGALIGRQVLGRCSAGARALAQHVKAEVHRGAALALAAGLRNGVADGARIDKLPAQQLDGTHCGRHHGARAQALQQATFAASFGQEALGQGNRAGRQARKHLVRPFGTAGFKVGAAELIGGQGDGRFGIGHAQQRFGQAHQRQTLGAGDGVLAQQRFHGPEGRRCGARALHPGPRHGHHRRPIQPPLQGGQGGGHDLGFGAVREGQARRARRYGGGPG